MKADAKARSLAVITASYGKGFKLAAGTLWLYNGRRSYGIKPADCSLLYKPNVVGTIRDGRARLIS